MFCGRSSRYPKKVPLKCTDEFKCDNGSEFKGYVTKLVEKNNVKINISTTKYRHLFKVIIEWMNKTLIKIRAVQEHDNPTLRL